MGDKIMGSSSERLPSFKGPRDLSLSSRGGNAGASSKPPTAGSSNSQTNQARPKRVFTPNIPPKRDRGSGPSSASNTASTSSQSQNHASSGRGRSRGRGGPRGGARSVKQRGELVQAESIFSDGIGDPMQARKTSAAQYRSGYGGGRYKSATEGGSSRISSMNRATLNTLIKEEDDESNKKIFGSEKFEPEEEEDTNPDNPNVPIVLPLSSYVPEFFNEPATFENQATGPSGDAKADTSPANTEVSIMKIKQEKIDDDVPLVKIKQEKSVADTESTALSTDKLLGMMTLDSTTFAHVCRSTPPDGTLVYFQFPDELPVLEGSVRESVDQPSSGKSAAQLVSDINDLPEGFIGRLQILSTGRTRFIIGETSFDVDAGRPVGFRQELYSVDHEDQTLSNLGPICSKFVLTPDIEYLLRDMI